jgi:cystathionine beta-lyase
VWRGINTDEVGEPNVFAIPASIAAYKSGDWLDELNEYIFANKRFAAEYISEHLPKMHAVPSDATYLLWVDISAYSDNSEAFAKDLREKTGLYVSDGNRYGAGGKNFLRINLATQRANVKDGLSRLERYIKEIDK